MKTMVAALAALIACVLVSVRPAEACRCAPPPPPSEAFSRADAVFTGKVTKVTPKPHGGSLVTISIDEKFRGNLAGKSLVVTGGGMCSSVLGKGKAYFVYVTKSGAEWFSSLCGRTAKLADAAADLQYARANPS